MKKLLLATLLISSSAHAYIEVSTQLDNRNTITNRYDKYYNRNHVYIRNDTQQTQSYQLHYEYCQENYGCNIENIPIAIEAASEYRNDFTRERIARYKYAGYYNQNAKLTVSGAETKGAYDEKVINAIEV